MTSTTTDQLDQQQPDPQTCHRCEEPILAGEDTVSEVTMFLPAAEAPDGSDLVEFGEREVHEDPCASPTELQADREARERRERVIEELHDREERPHRPMTTQEHEEQVEADARAVMIFGCWPAPPPDPDDN